MSDKADKAALRREALARRAALAPDRRAALGEAICAGLLRLSPSWPAGPVSGYWPIRGEADPRPALRALAAQGRAILLPRMHPGEGLSFHHYAFGDRLVTAGFGLSEPAPDAPEDRPAVMLVPLAAFDKRAHRIGYGAGYYDRAIARLAGQGPRPLTIGMAFALQEIPEVPDEPHDRALDMIVTENEVVSGDEPLMKDGFDAT